MRVREVVAIDEVSDEDLRGVLGALGVSESNPNPTLEAIAAAYASPGWPAAYTVPFSSARKWSAASFEGRGTWVLGAPEMVAPDHAAVLERCSALAGDGARVLLLARADGTPSADTGTGPVAPTAIVVINQQLRPDAAETVAYFLEQGVTVKVISGDNPSTVGAIAREVGIDAGEPVDARTLGEEVEDRLHVQAGGGQQGVPHGELFHQHVVELLVEAIKDHRPGQAEAVGVQARRRQPDDRVADADAAAVDDALAFHGAHGETREVVVAGLVHAGQLGGLAANQGTAALLASPGNAVDDGGHVGGGQRSGGEVVQEEQGPGPRRQHVVDAHGHEVLADGVVLVGGDGHQQLGTDAVGAADEDGVFEGGQGLLEGEQPAEAADARQHPGNGGGAGAFTDALDGIVASIDVDSGVLVGEWLLGHAHSYP